jgi:hypothetical protein
MITGIEITHNANFVYNLIKERGISFHFGVDGTNSGVPLILGPEVDLRNDKAHEQHFTLFLVHVGCSLAGAPIEPPAMSG